MSEKTTWNHRLIRHKASIGNFECFGKEVSPYWCAIHEVYYQDGVPDMVTKEPMNISGETPEEVREYYEMMKSALENLS